MIDLEIADLSVAQLELAVGKLIKHASRTAEKRPGQPTLHLFFPTHLWHHRRCWT